MRNEHDRAAAHLDTLLRSGWGSREVQASLELDRNRFLIAAGNLNRIRRDLDRWVRKSEEHERWAEGMLLLAELNERLGRIRDAKAALPQGDRSCPPDSWLAQESTAGLARLAER